jgi:hypothetical protein
MDVNSALDTGLQGFQQAQTRINEAAQSIASQQVTDSTKDGIETKDLTESLVDLKSAENDAKANAQVIKTASDVLGTIIDINV